MTESDWLCELGIRWGIFEASEEPYRQASLALQVAQTAHAEALERRNEAEKRYQEVLSWHASIARGEEPPESGVSSLFAAATDSQDIGRNEDELASELYDKIREELENNHPDISQSIIDYEAFLRCIKLRREIDGEPVKEEPVKEEPVKEEPVTTEQTRVFIKPYWSEREYATKTVFLFGVDDSLQVVPVDAGDVDEARRWLIAAAPAMESLIPFHQARSFADKWAIDKPRTSDLPGGATS